MFTVLSRSNLPRLKRQAHMAGEDEEPLLAGAGGAARALASLQVEAGSPTRFATATARCGATNELRVLEVDEESWSVRTVGTCATLRQVSALAFAPAGEYAGSLAAIGKPSGASIATLPTFESMDHLESPPSQPELFIDSELDVSGRGHEAYCRQASFSPLSAGDFIALACEGELSWHRLREASARKEGTCEASCAGDSRYRSVACSPHTLSIVSAARGTAAELYDIRSNINPKVAIGVAHEGACRSIDFAPTSERLLATCGDDGCVRLWDTRKADECVSKLCGHTHFAWQARFNRFHEQLLASASSDCSSGLWSLGRSAQSDSEKERPQSIAEEDEDRLVAWIEDHPDSVYAVEWSSSDPWTFASLSHDGVLVLSCVPRSLRYRILL
jgi:WD40 repeat protein